MMDGIKGFTGISVSLDLAVFVTIILTLITWKITKDKERNELREKEKDNAKKELLKYLEKLRDNLYEIIDFRNSYNSESYKLSDEEKKNLQSKNSPLITEYQKNLYEFLFISSVYNKELYKILKESKDDFELAKKHGNIEIIVFSSVITMYKLLVEYVDEEIANDLLMTYYSITKEDAEKNQKFLEIKISDNLDNLDNLDNFLKLAKGIAIENNQKEINSNVIFAAIRYLNLTSYGKAVFSKMMGDHFYGIEPATGGQEYIDLADSKREINIPLDVNMKIFVDEVKEHLGDKDFFTIR